MRVVSSPHYSFDLSPTHQFPMAKYRRVFEMLQEYGALDDCEVITPRPAGLDELRQAHEADYVARFVNGELTPREERKLGFPWSEPLCRRALYATGGTLAAARCALQDGISANLAGGSHHAFAGHGEGYCAFNDMAVAVRVLRAEGFSRRVAVVDCDVHQGNGTAAILRGDPEVFTFSIHCQSNYPLEKVPGTRDVGLPNGVEDAGYLAILQRELDAIWTDFRPALVFYQAGVDPLAEDRLGRLSLTRAGLRARDMLVLRRCVETEVPVVVVLGGGYAPTVDETASAHAQTVRTALALGRG